MIVLYLIWIMKSFFSKVPKYGFFMYEDIYMQ